MMGGDFGAKQGVNEGRGSPSPSPSTVWLSEAPLQVLCPAYCVDLRPRLPEASPRGKGGQPVSPAPHWSFTQLAFPPPSPPPRTCPSPRMPAVCIPPRAPAVISEGGCAVPTPSCLAPEVICFLRRKARKKWVRVVSGFSLEISAQGNFPYPLECCVGWHEAFLLCSPPPSLGSGRVGQAAQRWREDGAALTRRVPSGAPPAVAAAVGLRAGPECVQP